MSIEETVLNYREFLVGCWPPLSEILHHSDWDDDPYFPKRLIADKKLLQQYREVAEKQSGVSFLGRLATYRYLDMHHVIGEALEFAGEFILSIKEDKKLPVFSNTEIF